MAIFDFKTTHSRITAEVTLFSRAGSQLLYSGWLLTLSLLFGLGGCGGLSPQEQLGVGILATTAVGAQAPSQEIQQTYYLGVFDPSQQVEPTVYRVRLHGQASFLSFVNFASGWLPAEVVDSLGTSIRFEKNDEGKQELKIERDDANKAHALTGRRLFLFGPEGFREAPANQRLVIAMGSSPESFFDNVNQALAIVAEATQGGPVDTQIETDLRQYLELVGEEKDDLQFIDLQLAKGAE